MDCLRICLLLFYILVTLTQIQGQNNANDDVPPSDTEEKKPERWWHFFGRADGSDWKVIFAYIAFSFGAILLLIGFCYLTYIACCRRNSNKKFDYKSSKSKGKNKQAKYLDNRIGGKSAARHEKDNDSLQVDVATFYQPNSKHNSKISEVDSKKHNSHNHTEKKAEEGGLHATTAVPVIAAAGVGAVATAALVNERDSDDDEHRNDEGIGPSLADSSGHSNEHNDTLKDASSLPDSAHGEDTHSGFGAAMIHHGGERSSRRSSRQSSRRSHRSGSTDSIDRHRETRDDDMSRKTTPLPLRSETDVSHVDTDRGSLHTERDNLGFEPDSTSKRSSNLSHHGFARGGSPDSRAFGEDYRESHVRRDSVEDVETSRVSVAEVHNVYNADDRRSDIDVHKPDEDETEGGGHHSGLRRWPSQESLERASSTRDSNYRQSGRPASDVGSINPTWRDQDDVQGVGIAAVEGHRHEDTRDSESEHDLTRDEDEDDRSARGDERDSLADYERPVGVTAAMVAAGDDDEAVSQRSSTAVSSQMYQSQARTSSIQARTPSPQARTSSLQARTPSPQGRTSSIQARTTSPQARTPSPTFESPARTPSPQARIPTPPRSPSPMYQTQQRSPSPSPCPQSPLGGPAPAGVSSGLAGLGTLIAARAKKRENGDVDYTSLEREIDRSEDPSEAWLKQNAKPNRVSSTNIRSKLGMFEELKEKSNTSWDNRRTQIRDSEGPVEYGRSYLPDNRDSGGATISTASPFTVDDTGEMQSGTLVRKHIAQLESQQSREESSSPVAGASILRREGAFRKKSETGNDNDMFGEETKPLETVSIPPDETIREEIHSTHNRNSSKGSNTWIPQDNEAKSTPRASAIGNYENAVIENENRASASLDPNVGDWPDEGKYARSDMSRSDIGSGSNFTSSRIGTTSQVYEEEEEDQESIRYEVEPGEEQRGL